MRSLAKKRKKSTLRRKKRKTKRRRQRGGIVEVANQNRLPQCVANAGAGGPDPCADCPEMADWCNDHIAANLFPRLGVYHPWHLRLHGGDGRYGVFVSGCGIPGFNIDVCADFYRRGLYDLYFDYAWYNHMNNPGYRANIENAAGGDDAAWNTFSAAVNNQKEIIKLLLFDTMNWHVGTPVVRDDQINNTPVLQRLGCARLRLREISQRIGVFDGSQDVDELRERWNGARMRANLFHQLPFGGDGQLDQFEHGDGVPQRIIRLSMMLTSIALISDNIVWYIVHTTITHYFDELLRRTRSNLVLQREGAGWGIINNAIVWDRVLGPTYSVNLDQSTKTFIENLPDLFVDPIAVSTGADLFNWVNGYYGATEDAFNSMLPGVNIDDRINFTDIRGADPGDGHGDDADEDVYNAMWNWQTQAQAHAAGNYDFDPPVLVQPEHQAAAEEQKNQMLARRPPGPAGGGGGGDAAGGGGGGGGGGAGGGHFMQRGGRRKSRRRRRRRRKSRRRRTRRR